MRTAWIALWLVACGGGTDEHVVTVVLDSRSTCVRTLFAVASIAVDVMRVNGGLLEPIDGLSRCLPGPSTTDPADVVDALGDAGDIASGVGDGDPVQIRVRGFAQAECRRNEDLCGVSCPAVDAGDPPDEVGLRFVCNPLNAVFQDCAQLRLTDLCLDVDD